MVKTNPTTSTFAPSCDAVSDNKGNITAHRLPIADVPEGELHAVPPISSAAGVIDGARGGVAIPDEDRDRVKRHLSKYFDKMGDQPPRQAD